MKEYPETQQEGWISLENLTLQPFGINHADHSTVQGRLGVQIAKDGRVWVCINGLAFLRFKPHSGKEQDSPKKETATT